MRARSTRWSFLGRVPYEQGLVLQEEARSGVKAGTGPERLLLLEHDPVFTLGRNAERSDLVADESWRRARGIAVHETDRGGQVTYHGPGQLVGYPILDLAPDRKDVRRYVRDLQEVLVRTLLDFGVEAAGRPAPEIGVWAAGGKIASIGVHLSRWVTTHGFALNVTTDLGSFAGIVPCGLAAVRMVSVETLTGARPSLESVAGALARHFGEVFAREMVAEPAAALS